MTTFTNITKGPKGVNAKTGLVMIDPGKTSADLDVEEAELTSAENTGWFEIDAAPKALKDHTVAELRAIAEADQIDLGDAEKKADIVAAIELAREAKA